MKTAVIIVTVLLFGAGGCGKLTGKPDTTNNVHQVELREKSKPTFDELLSSNLGTAFSNLNFIK